MQKISLAEVRKRSIEGRFFSYDGWQDRLFSTLSIFLIWLFLRLGWSGNAVSFLSGGVALAGGIAMASPDPLIVALGSFGYLLFYLLDYVDGGVSRIRGTSGIGGQYIDWIMHVVSAVGIAGGLFAGALAVTGAWIIPFGLLTIVAAALSLDRYAFAWFAICMHQQQRRAEGNFLHPQKISYEKRVFTPIHKLLKVGVAFIFHENYAIFMLPCLALLQLTLSLPTFFDFRVLLIIIGGSIYFPLMIFDIWKMATDGRIDNAYGKLFFGDQIPDLPSDHFIN
jgi:hypothetical protein